jgi:hypothetical protein
MPHGRSRRRRCRPPTPDRRPNPVRRTAALWRIYPADRFVVAQMVPSTIRCHSADGARAAKRPTRAGQPRRAVMPIKVERFQPEGMNVRMSAGRLWCSITTVRRIGKQFQ